METSKDKQIGAVVLDVIRTANLLERLGGQYASKVGLGSVQQYMILSMLDKSDSLTMSDLRQNTLVTKQAITGLIERMKKQGYINTKKDSNDRRRTIVEMTSYGRELLEFIHPERIKGNREAFNVLTDEELRQLQDILKKLVDHLN